MTVDIDSGSAPNALCDAEKKGVNDMISIMEPVAKQLASFDAAGGSGALPTGTINAVSLAVQAYENDMAAYGSGHLNPAQTKLAAALTNFTATAKAEGWVTASEWYWHTARIQEDFSSAVNQLPTTKNPDGETLAPLVSKNYQSYIQAAARYAFHGGEIAQNGFSGAAAASSGTLGLIEKYLNPFQDVLAVYMSQIGGQSPMLGLTEFGHHLLDAEGATLTAYAFYKTDVAGVQGIVDMIPVIGKGLAGEVDAVSGDRAVSAVAPFIWLFLLSVLGCGMTLAYYLPALPFVLFTLGVVSCLIVWVEAVLAAPLWAASHGVVEGEGWAGTHARQGYMLVMTVILRPSLMIFGIFLSFQMLNAFSWFVAESFENLFGSLVDGHMGLFSMFAGIFIITGLMTTVYHRIFGLITLIPENVPAWIGQLAHKLGEQSGAQESGRTMVAGAAVMRGSAGHKAHVPKPGDGRGAKPGSKVTSTPGEGGKKGGKGDSGNGDGGTGGTDRLSHDLRPGNRGETNPTESNGGQ
ncbi:MAG: DotA/TraY family protein [Halothiobacillus sp.]|nr:DotA/TraY family protein [Halothiobacillus sp.]